MDRTLSCLGIDAIMYDIYDASNEKVFGCSHLGAVIDYITEIGVENVITGTKVRVNLANGEYVDIGFGCPTAAHDWIVKHVPGKLVKVISRKDGSEYIFKEY